MTVLDPEPFINAMGPFKYAVMMEQAASAKAAAAAAEADAISVTLQLWMTFGPVLFLALIVGGVLCLTAFTSRGCRKSRSTRPPEKR